MEFMNTAFDNCPPPQRSPAVLRMILPVADAALAGGRRQASIGVIKTKLADATVAEVMQVLLPTVFRLAGPAGRFYNYTYSRINQYLEIIR